MANKPMKLKAFLDEGGNNVATVKAIVYHPMESGLRKDKVSGKIVPAHYITEAIVEHNGKTVMTCLWGPAVSQNPYVSFRIKNAKKGDTVKLSWVDSMGEKEVGDTKVE